MSKGKYKLSHFTTGSMLLVYVPNKETYGKLTLSIGRKPNPFTYTELLFMTMFFNHGRQVKDHNICAKWVRPL